MREIAPEISRSHAVVLRRACFGGSRPARTRLCGASESDSASSVRRPAYGSPLRRDWCRRVAGAERPRSLCPLAAVPPRLPADRRKPAGDRRRPCPTCSCPSRFTRSHGNVPQWLLTPSLPRRGAALRCVLSGLFRDIQSYAVTRAVRARLSGVGPSGRGAASFLRRARPKCDAHFTLRSAW